MHIKFLLKMFISDQKDRQRIGFRNVLWLRKKGFFHVLTIATTLLQNLHPVNLILLQKFFVKNMVENQRHRPGKGYNCDYSLRLKTVSKGNASYLSLMYLSLTCICKSETGVFQFYLNSYILQDIIHIHIKQRNWQLIKYRAAFETGTNRAVSLETLLVKIQAYGRRNNVYVRQCIKIIQHNTIWVWVLLTSWTHV